MELLRHHMTISRLKYQTNVVNRYAIDYSLFSIYVVLQLLETWVLRCLIISINQSDMFVRN